MLSGRSKSVLFTTVWVALSIPAPHVALSKTEVVASSFVREREQAKESLQAGLPKLAGGDWTFSVVEDGHYVLTRPALAVQFPADVNAFAGDQSKQRTESVTIVIHVTVSPKPWKAHTAQLQTAQRQYKNLGKQLDTICSNDLSWNQLGLNCFEPRAERYLKKYLEAQETIEQLSGFDIPWSDKLRVKVSRQHEAFGISDAQETDCKAKLQQITAAVAAMHTP
jgi:hypothetical protein